MIVETEIINGVNVGVEYFDDEYYGRGLLIDLVFLRFLISWGR